MNVSGVRKLAKSLVVTVSFLVGFSVWGAADSRQETLLKEIAKQVPNFGEVDSGLYRGGQPQESVFPLFKQFGIKTVVSFRNEPEVIQAEKQWAGNNGLQLVTIPWSGQDRPREKDVDTFLSVVSAPPNRPVFVHCKQGSERTGVMVACYRIQSDKWSPTQAFEEMERYHFRTFWYGHLKQFVFSWAEKRAGSNHYVRNPLEVLKTSILSAFYSLRKLLT